MSHDTLSELLSKQFNTSILNCTTDFGMRTYTVALPELYAVLKFLKDDAACNFFFLTDLTGYQSADEQHLYVVYHLHNLQTNQRIRVKSQMPIQKPEYHTVTDIWPSANWMERETYDFFGIQFKGHPRLKRILNVDEMDIFPLRKEFPLEDQTRDDKNDKMFGR